MKKTISLILLFLLLLSLLTIMTSAEAADAVIEEGHSDSETLPFTDAISGFLTENGSTLLGLLTFVGSVLVAFLYKTGLLPMLRTGLTALREILHKNSDLTESFTQKMSQAFGLVEEKLALLPPMIEKTDEALREFEKRLLALEKALTESEADRRCTAEVLRTETELFYEMLSSVNLPEAQKESMTESYYRMKKKLEAEQ